MNHHFRLAVRFKWDISPSEGHFRVKTIMAACSKLDTSNSPLEWRISKGSFWWTLQATMILCTGKLFGITPCVPLGRAHPSALIPSKGLRSGVRASKGLGQRDEPFWMECRVGLRNVDNSWTRSSNQNQMIHKPAPKFWSKSNEPGPKSNDLQ